MRLRCVLLLALASSALAAPGTFRNPVNPHADPWVGHHDGRYWLATTRGDRIELWSARSAKDLANARPVTVWQKGKGVWAPEFHRFETPKGPRWFCYFTMTDGRDVDHRMYVIESRTSRIDGPYGEPKLINTDPENKFYAIDGTVFVHPNGKAYFLWAGHPGHVLYISEMENPWTLKGPRQRIDASGFGCPDIREGPFIIQRGDRIFLTYSACHTERPDYKVGALWTTLDKDPMDPKSWVQIEQPILARADENGVYGPGHHSFFKSPDGREDWIAYHAKTTDQLTTNHRTTRLQKLEWDEQGMPIPIVPLSLDEKIPLPSGDPAAR